MAASGATPHGHSACLASFWLLEVLPVLLPVTRDTFVWLLEVTPEPYQTCPVAGDFRGGARSGGGRGRGAGGAQSPTPGDAGGGGRPRRCGRRLLQPGECSAGCCAAVRLCGKLLKAAAVGARGRRACRRVPASTVSVSCERKLARPLKQPIFSLNLTQVNLTQLD